MGIFFIWFSLSVGLSFIVMALLDIRTESKRRNYLLEDQNKILQNNTIFLERYLTKNNKTIKEDYYNEM
jgi:heme exporter protein D